MTIVSILRLSFVFSSTEPCELLFCYISLRNYHSAIANCRIRKNYSRERMTSKHITDKALQLMRGLPRVSLANIRDNPGSKKSTKRGRGQHGGDKHGAGDTRLNYMRLGYETGNFPFYLRFPKEPYYSKHHLRREYLPITMQVLQLHFDTNRIDPSKPIDLTQICNSGIYIIKPDTRQYGFQLKDEGIEFFKTKVNIEVQHASELVIATIERLGGVIRTAYYDTQALWAMKDTRKFFAKGVPIPRRMLPPQDAVAYYTDPKNRGYLADPEAISRERLILAQKYGYTLPRIEDDPQYDMLTATKDPRQVFFGLEPGWVINLADQTIIKPDTTQSANDLANEVD